MYSRIADAFAMSDATWRRHENPWSVWTRVAVLPVLTALLLRAEALGWALWPLLAALAAWIWVNPRAFPPPRDRDGWSARAVRGERIWLAAPDRRAPPFRAATLRAPIPGLGLPLWIWGLWAGEPLAAWAGAGLVIALKLWFLDATAALAAEEG